MQYSTDGVDFKNLSTGTYAYKYTKYVGGEPQEVSAAEKITDGVAKTSLAPANYISFTFDIPNEAANADRLYIRMVPGSLSAKGDKAPAAGGVIRMDTVTVTGNPLIASDLCGYVPAEPQSGVVAVGSELTLTSATEGVTIHYSVNGGAEQIYDASAKPVSADLPAAGDLCDKGGYCATASAVHSPSSAGTGGNGKSNAERRQRGEKYRGEPHL